MIFSAGLYSAHLLLFFLLLMFIFLFVFLVLSFHFVCFFSLIKTRWFLWVSIRKGRGQRRIPDNDNSSVLWSILVQRSGKIIIVIKNSNKMMYGGQSCKKILHSRCSFLTYEKPIYGIVAFSKLEALFICELQLPKMSACWLQILKVEDHTI